MGPGPARVVQQYSSSLVLGGSRTGRSALAVPGLQGQKSGVGEINCTVCYLHQFPLVLESSSLLQPSGPWSPNLPWPRAGVFSGNESTSCIRQASSPPRSQLPPPHHNSLSPVEAGGLLPCPVFPEGCQWGPAPLPALLSLSSIKPSFSTSDAQGRQSQAGSQSADRRLPQTFGPEQGQGQSQAEAWQLQAGLESVGREGLQPPKTSLSLSRGGQQICDLFVTRKMKTCVI